MEEAEQPGYLREERRQGVGLHWEWQRVVRQQEVRLWAVWQQAARRREER